MQRRSHNLVAAGVILVAVLGPVACATSEANREMIPVERVTSYSEQARYDAAAVYPPGAYSPGDPFDPRCQKYRKRIRNLDTAYQVAAGVGLVATVIGMLTEDDTVRQVAGLANIGATLTEAGTATAADITSDQAAEKGCWIPD